MKRPRLCDSVRLPEHPFGRQGKLPGWCRSGAEAEVEVRLQAGQSDCLPGLPADLASRQVVFIAAIGGDAAALAAKGAIPAIHIGLRNTRTGTLTANHLMRSPR